jgi:hypothetical protein
MSPDDRRRFNRLKELLLAAMRSKSLLYRLSISVLYLEDEPTYCTQRVVRSDFGNESDDEET